MPYKDTPENRDRRKASNLASYYRRREKIMAKQRARSLANAPPPDMSSDGEEWRPIAGYEGLYEVSNYGRVRSTRFTGLSYVGKILKPSVHPYPLVHLSKDGMIKTLNVHRLTAVAFLGTPPTPRHETNHIDGNKLNGHVSNLEWVTHSENQRHAIQNGLLIYSNAARPRSQGELNPGSKLNKDQVREIKQLKEESTRIFWRVGLV